MERKDVERVEKELDEILQIMEPASFLQGSGTEKLTGEQMENTREELAVSRRPETEGQNKISGDGRGGRPPGFRRTGGKRRKERKRQKKSPGQQKHGWTKILATAETLKRSRRKFRRS